LRSGSAGGLDLQKTVVFKNHKKLFLIEQKKAVFKNGDFLQL
jgi:hypothetical protein